METNLTMHIPIRMLPTMIPKITKNVTWKKKKKKGVWARWERGTLEKSVGSVGEECTSISLLIFFERMFEKLLNS